MENSGNLEDLSTRNIERHNIEVMIKQSVLKREVMP